MFRANFDIRLQPLKTSVENNFNRLYLKAILSYFSSCCKFAIWLFQCFKLVEKSKLYLFSFFCFIEKRSKCFTSDLDNDRCSIRCQLYLSPLYQAYYQSCALSLHAAHYLVTLQPFTLSHALQQTPPSFTDHHNTRDTHNSQTGAFPQFKAILHC